MPAADDRRDAIIREADRIIVQKGLAMTLEVSAQINGVHPAEVYRVLHAEGYRQVSELTFAPPF
ncbi:MAG: hypothetical protein ACOC00_00015 [Halothiobacillaceae bacterium]